MERKDILTLLARRMTKLPTVPKKVLAMYYYENMRLLNIANCLGLAESRIRQIHLQEVTSLRTLFYSIKSEKDSV
jgi:RNA polymerase sigma factor for flagellar operon FliA